MEYAEQLSKLMAEDTETMQSEYEKFEQYSKQIEELEAIVSSNRCDYEQGRFSEPGFVPKYLQLERSKKNLRKLKHQQQMSINKIRHICEVNLPMYKALACKQE